MPEQVETNVHFSYLKKTAPYKQIIQAERYTSFQST